MPLTQENIVTSAGNISASLQLTPADHCLNIMPLFHIHGLIAVISASMSKGASVCCSAGFNALKFIGLYLCLPSWQKNFTYYDDSRQDLIYYDFENFFNINKEHLIKEIYFIRKWYKSETDHYHLYKSDVD